MPGGSRARRTLAIALVGLFLAATGACSGDDGTIGIVDAADAPADLAFEIPAGYGELVDAGEGYDIMPATLEVEVGDVIELVNNDDRGHLIGFFFVGAEETIRHEFTAPGVFEGTCTVHSSGEIAVIVT